MRARTGAALGARNPTLMSMMAERLKPASVETADAIGWFSQAIEAQASAYLVVRMLNGLPTTFPATTGVKQPMPRGILWRSRAVDPPADLSQFRPSSGIADRRTS